MDTKDNRNILDTLKTELDFIEKGGYGRSVREPWKPTSIFQDSPSCFCYPDRQHDDCCLLMQFVPLEARAQSVPCHHIPLNANGVTITDLERDDQQALESTVRGWLQQTIARLEAGGGHACESEEGLAHQPSNFDRGE